MFKRMRLGTKLILAFISVAATTLILGGVAYYGAVKSKVSIHEVGSVRLPGIETVLKMQVQLETLVGSIRTLLNPENTLEVRQEQYHRVAEARNRYGEARTFYETLPHAPEEMQAWNEFLKLLPEWVAANDEILKLSCALDEVDIINPGALLTELQRFRADHHAMEAKVASLVLSGETLDGDDDPTACHFGQWLTQFSTRNPRLQSIVSAVQRHHNCFHETAKKIRDQMQTGKKDECEQLFRTVMQPASHEVTESLERLTQEVARAKEQQNRLAELTMGRTRQLQAQAFTQLDNVVQINHRLAAEQVRAAHAQSVFLATLSLVAAVIGVALAVALGLVVTRAITGPICRIIAGLTAGSEQVAAASRQVSAASQSLAEGATEQAAGLEETSSSLEEMSSMTKQNADNAQQANTLAAEARKSANTGAEAMTRMSQAINDIQKSSDETAKIIKVIDEIAFQTNLLALNAAVEAARAGEAGKGFAVVAEEVRNLAMRSAEAAKNTASMIEESVKNANHGVDIASEVGKVLDEIVHGIGKTTDLVSEIAAASQEQAQGIDQVNTAVSQMDKVTQQNAANAEESAGASEELSSQAEAMHDIVGELIALVGGSASEASGRHVNGLARQTKKKQSNGRLLRPSDKTWHKIAAGKVVHPAIAPGDDALDTFNS
ncbi:MAG TPA: methyl-accepting chemotaxis protein [Sedimentisphaerales bacterium]|nr:methyl-accepting chemotaxis protein [Sedimentisphaerales bacterium]